VIESILLFVRVSWEWGVKIEVNKRKGTQKLTTLLRGIKIEVNSMGQQKKNLQFFCLALFFDLFCRFLCCYV